MGGRTKGVLCVLCSAFLFGFAPIIGKISYEGGSNALMLTLLRNMIAIPVLLLLAVVNKVPVRVNRLELKKIILHGVFGVALTSSTLYMSFHYIPIGVATTLHFIYPVLVTLVSVFLFKEKLKAVHIAILAVTIAGIIMVCDLSGNVSWWGIILALISAAAYAFQLLFQYRSGLVYLFPFKLSFYSCIVTSACMFAVSGITGYFTLELTAKAWYCTFIVMILLSVCGVSLLQIGLKQIGSTTAAMLGIFEPITSIVCGTLILGDAMPPSKIVGCLLLFAGVIILTVSSRSNTVAGEEVEQPENI